MIFARFTALAGMCLTLGACTYLSPVACGLSDADHVLAADAPLKAAWCRAHPALLAGNPGIATYCNHIPTSVAAALITQARQLHAIETGRAE